MRKQRVSSLLLFALLAAPSAARAQTSSSGGFALERYEPTAAGEWSFAVDHPWYTSVRDFSIGLTLDYSHDPLVLGRRDADGTFTKTQSIVEHQLVGHLDVAGSLFDRLTVSGTLPLVMYEGGTEGAGIAPNSFVVGDPRLGVMVRLFGQPYREAFSMHLGANLWIPIGAADNHAGDDGVRLLPKLVLGGLAADHLLWSFTGGFLVRSEAGIGSLGDAVRKVGPELQLGAAVAWADVKGGWAVGPEMTLATVTAHAFEQEGTSSEILLGGHYRLLDWLQAGLAAGVGLQREAGSPDFRAILRLAYAPFAPQEPPSDRDHDGIYDQDDACPDVFGVASEDPKKHGCPVIVDRDKDGVMDPDDLCPDTPKGDHPDPKRKGCPDPDTDKDGVLDSEDECPTTPAGEHPSADKKGCPDEDTDHDLVWNAQDQCREEPAGLHPDPEREGCPLADRDRDGVPDVDDACPDVPGAPSTTKKKNGCPGLVEIQGKKIIIMKPVFFATNKDVILPTSNAVLAAVADLLHAEPGIKRVSIDGHTDDQGKAAYNRDLSERRAKSVLKWLVAHGIEAGRLEAHGYGPDKPIESNKTAKGRAANRRVEFNIIDTPQYDQ